MNDSAQALSQHTPVLPVEAMISYLPRCWENCSEVYWHPRSEWNTVSPVMCGHLRTAISIASHNGVGAACCRPNRVPDCFLRAAAGDGRQVHEPLPGADIGDIAHPPALPACWRRESRRTRSGREPRARRPGRWRRVLSAWLCGLQALGAHDGCAPPPGLVSTPLRAPAAWTLRYP